MSGHSTTGGCNGNCSCEHQAEHACNCAEHAELSAEQQEGHSEAAPDAEEPEPDFEPEGAPTIESPAPDEIAELCAQCVAYVKRAVGLELDFTPDTLSILDHYVSLVRTSIEERPALLHLVANSVGAYFGEMVRQKYDGFWLTESPDVQEWCVCTRSVYFKFNPVGVVHESIAQNSTHPGPGGEFHLAPDERNLIQERLAAVPAVAADQYYLLSTRMEAIEIVIETLRVVANPEGQVLGFEAEDYESS